MANSHAELDLLEAHVSLPMGNWDSFMSRENFKTSDVRANVFFL
jgi:hypothetical protein